MSDRALTYGRAYLDGSTLTDGGPLTFVASTPGLNVYGFSLRADGWRLENFERSPVVLWAHDASQPPIGRASMLRDGDNLVAEVVMDADDEFAMTVDRKVRGGFLNAVSVGWDFVDESGRPALGWWRMKPEVIRDELFYDLAELSIVPVPGNREALRTQQRQAMAALGRELLEVADAEPVTPDLRGLVSDEVAAALARLGVTPTRTPGPVTDPEPARDAAGIPDDAARLVLAAFAPQGGQP